MSPTEAVKQSAQFCVACEETAVLFLWRNRLYARCVGTCGKVREVAE